MLIKIKVLKERELTTMKKNTTAPLKKFEVFKDIEDFMGKYLPAKALAEISRMIDYSGLNGLSIKVKNVSARTTTPMVDIHALEYNMSYNPENPFMLNLDYDMRVYRKDAFRRADTNTEVIFKGNDGRIYILSLELTVDLNTINNDYDDLLFSACYLWAKEILESIDISKYISKTMKLPENYSCVAEESKEFYDGYVTHRNHGKIKHDIKGGTVK